MKIYQLCCAIFLISGCLANDCQVDGEFSDIQEMLDCYTDRYRLIGIDVGVFSGNSWLMRAQSGVRVSGDETKVSEKDMFIMGSTGKSITSTLAARLVAQGYISWDITAKVMFQDSGLFTLHPTYWLSTFEQFLSHGSGAPDLIGVLEEHGDMIDNILNKTSWEPDYDNREERIYLAQSLLSSPTAVPQGTFLYSIGAFTIASAMMELATNKTFEQLMIEEVFDPLGMEDCGFGPTTLSSSMPPDQPWGHLSDPTANHIVPITPGPYANIASSMIADGGLHCNMDSWQRYLATHMAEDEDFLPEDVWSHIHNPITQGFYGFGWFFDNSNPLVGTVWSHGGTDGRNSAMVVIVPRLNLGVTLLMNNAGLISGGRQGLGYQKTLEWIFTHILGKEENTKETVTKVMTKLMKNEARSFLYR